MWLALAGAIIVEVFATLALRASDGFRKKAWIAPIVAGYLLSFYLLYVSLGLGSVMGPTTRSSSGPDVSPHQAANTTSKQTTPNSTDSTGPVGLRSVNQRSAARRTTPSPAAPSNCGKVSS